MKKILVCGIILMTFLTSGYTLNSTYNKNISAKFLNVKNSIAVNTYNKNLLKKDAYTYLQKKWIIEPKVKLYSLDGREEFFNESEVDNQLTVGWYLKPSTLLYSKDGNSQVFPTEDIEKLLSEGWLKVKPELPNEQYVKYNWKSNDIEERTKYIYYYLKSKGFSNAGIAAILGNIQQESNIQANAGGSGAYGIVQWTGGRKKNLIKMAGTTIPTMKHQLDFLLYELSKSYSSLYVLLKTNMSVDSLTVKFEKEFERAGKPCMVNRKKFANNWYKKIQNW